jgi:hypothetical protein
VGFSFYEGETFIEIVAFETAEFKEVLIAGFCPESTGRRLNNVYKL